MHPRAVAASPGFTTMSGGFVLARIAETGAACYTPRRGQIMKSQRLAVGLMIGQAILFAVETAMIHHLGSRASGMQLALLRSSAGLLLVGSLAWKTGWSV